MDKGAFAFASNWKKQYTVSNLLITNRQRSWHGAYQGVGSGDQRGGWRSYTLLLHQGCSDLLHQGRKHPYCVQHSLYHTLHPGGGGTIQGFFIG